MGDFARWSNTVQIKIFDEKWDRQPATGGVYLIKTLRPIQRIGGKDRAGILYIGRAVLLRRRVWGFLYAYHTASAFLWTHLEIARVVFDNERIRTVMDIENALWRLKVRYSTPIHKSRLVRAERALMFAYFSRFGEAPPLNLSINQRWLAKPSQSDLRWAEVGIEQ